MWPLKRLALRAMVSAQPGLRRSLVKDVGELMANPTSPPTKVRGSYAKTAARREEIVRASFEVFSVSGYHAASLREIADRVGLTQAGILHHFANKWELLEAVLTLRDEEAYLVTGINETTLGRAAMHGFLDLVEHNVREPGIVELFCVLSAEATNSSHPAHKYFQDRYVWTVNRVTDAYGDMLTRGELLPGIDPRSAAVRTVAIMDGLQVQWLLDRGALDMREELRLHIQSLTSVEFE
ncbi:MAG: TetR/AcrR family transcriptional regulator [Glaciihabitans sp.]|nr:TetR/AcrR family transcriptional regulator [Glaciihabitans sp.]